MVEPVGFSGPGKAGEGDDGVGLGKGRGMSKKRGIDSRLGEEVSVARWRRV